MYLAFLMASPVHVPRSGSLGTCMGRLCSDDSNGGASHRQPTGLFEEAQGEGGAWDLKLLLEGVVDLGVQIGQVVPGLGSPEKRVKPGGIRVPVGIKPAERTRRGHHNLSSATEWQGTTYSLRC